MATAALDSPTSVRLTLTTDGSTRFDGFAARYYGEKVATEVNGVIVNTPTIYATHFNGTMIVSSLTLSAAQNLVKTFGGDLTVPSTAPPDPTLEHAQRVCASFKPPGHPNAMFGSVSADTAGNITTQARRFSGNAVAPWDQLPADHFVAVCSYIDTSASANTPTTTCPDGAIVSLALPLQYLVDDQGRSTPYPTGLGGINPGALCTGITKP